MRIKLEDHARFHRGVLHVAVVCSALACAAALIGSDRFPPAAAVLAAAMATLALALGHLRLVIDPVADTVARAAADSDGEGRALLGRAAAARDAIVRAVRGEGGLPSADGRAMIAAAGKAAVALAEVCQRRQRLAARINLGTSAQDGERLEALEQRSAAAADAGARDAYARAATAQRERMARAAAMGAVVERLDARLHAAVAEMEGAALAVGTRAELGPADHPAALGTALDRLRTAGADLGAECEALVEVAAL
jgi:hypothetical protein